MAWEHAGKECRGMDRRRRVTWAAHPRPRAPRQPAAPSSATAGASVLEQAARCPYVSYSQGQANGRGAGSRRRRAPALGCAGVWRGARRGVLRGGPRTPGRRVREIKEWWAPGAPLQAPGPAATSAQCCEQTDGGGAKGSGLNLGCSRHRRCADAAGARPRALGRATGSARWGLGAAPTERRCVAARLRRARRRLAGCCRSSAPETRRAQCKFQTRGLSSVLETQRPRAGPASTCGAPARRRW